MAAKIGIKLDACIALHQQGDFVAAEAGYRQLLAHTPRNPELLHLFGLLRAQQGFFDEGRTHLRQAVSAAPNIPLYRFNLATICLESGNLEEAVAEFNRCLELSPAYAGASLGLGRALAALGRYGLAVEALEEAMAEQPDDPVPLLLLGELHLRHHFCDKAVSILDECRRRAGDAPEIIALLACAYEGAGDLDRALELYRSLAAAGDDQAAADDVVRLEGLCRLRIEAQRFAADLAELTGAIRRGQQPTEAALRAIFDRTNPDQRVEANLQLARACLEQTDRSWLEQARHFAEQAWFSSGFADRVLPIVADSLTALGDLAGVKAAYARAAVEAALRSYCDSTTEMTDLAVIANRISAREDVPWEEVLPLLCQPGRNDRVAVNLVLARAMLHRNAQGDMDRTVVMIARAWEISGFSDEVFPIHLAMGKLRGDVLAVAEAYRRNGLRHWAAGRYTTAFDALFHAQYAHTEVSGIDHVDIDHEVLAQIRRTAEAQPLPEATVATGRRVRLGYLLFGVTHLNSIMVRHAKGLISRHDETLFDVTCYIPERLEHILSLPHGRQTLTQLRALNLNVVTAPEVADDLASLWQLAARIRADGTELLIDFAALADYRRYFLTCLRPTPLIAGYVLGHPNQFAPTHLDFCITSTPYAQMDIPSDCELVQVAYDLPDLAKVVPSLRCEFAIPDHAFVIAASGRYVKFRATEFWRGVAEILAALPAAHFLAIGVAPDQVDLTELPAVVVDRIHCTGWRTNNLNIVAMADVVLDTYPSGGGYALTEPMAMGIPAMAFRNDHTRRFDQATWSPIEETIVIPDILFSRGDFAAVARQAQRLAEDQAYRQELGERCRREVLARSDIGRTTRSLEQVVLRRLGRTHPTD